jgi:energy-coupling factor transporter ATP-binding protein EcfA2
MDGQGVRTSSAPEDKVTPAVAGESAQAPEDASPARARRRRKAPAAGAGKSPGTGGRAEAVPESAGVAGPDTGATVPARGDDPPEPPDVEPGGAGDAEAGHDAAPDPAGEPHVRVDARALESALLNLRKRVAAIPVLYETPGMAEAKAEQAKLLSQIDDYLLPRLRRSTAPILVALVGSTGAGKSTLVNSIVGRQISATGVRRPTTNSPVLACHPDEADWFAENNFLPRLPRVRQEGLARPGRDGLLVLAASEGVPKGLALLDTPDIDSVVQEHHEFAYQFLDASDLWLFVTSASRYADAPVWQVLQHARDRGASLGIVLSRVPPGSRSELVGHFAAMLDANGIGDADRFVVPETRVTDGMLPPDAFQAIHAWLTDTARREDRRVAVLTQTMAGVLDTFRTRVPALAAHAEAQLGVRSRLRGEAEAPYRDALAKVKEATGDGSLLRGEVQARWADVVATGELTRTLRSRKAPRQGKPRQGKRARKRQAPERATAMKAALRSALESAIVSAADGAAEDADGRWRAGRAGVALLAAAGQRPGTDADRLFASTFGSEADGAAGEPAGTTALGRSTPDLLLRAARAVSAWQDHVLRLVQDIGRAKRTRARSASLDDESLALLMVLATLGEGATVSHAASSPDDSNILAMPRSILTAVLGEQSVSDICRKARTELNERARLLFDEELLRFAEVIDSAGTCNEIAGVRLYQAAYMLEALQ